MRSLFQAGTEGPGLEAGYINGIKPVYLLMALFAVMLIAGLLLGGFGPVLTNARIICHDCIGIF
jgi:hypothetical protein